jgi:hypothetical protein
MDQKQIWKNLESSSDQSAPHPPVFLGGDEFLPLPMYVTRTTLSMLYDTNFLDTLEL